MNSPRQTEMEKLRAIQTQLTTISDRIASRLPTQRGHLAALVSARKWQLTTQYKLRAHTLTQESLDEAAKKLRMEVGVFEYSAKEQSEILTRALFKLDDILSHGDAEIKETRKALVLKIQEQLERADALKASAAELKAFAERVIARFPTVPVDEEETVEEPMEVETETALPEEEAEQETAPDAQSVHDEDEASSLRAVLDEESDDEEEEQQPEPIGKEECGEEEHENEGEDEEDAEYSVDVSSLPVWRPYYQIQQRSDGLYLQANLHGVDPRHVRVEAMPQNGVVRITGFKLPTQKDLLLSRFSGTPTFGRFEIVERFPSNQLRLDLASQQFAQDGTLQLRLPFHVVQRPRVIRRVTPFEPFGLQVW